jgi:hypothetical protein
VRTTSSGSSPSNSPKPPRTCSPKRAVASATSWPLPCGELKLPNIGLADQAARAAFVTAATDIVADLAEPEHRRDDTWVNILNAPDGGWGLGGKGYTDDALIVAITDAGASAASV